MPKSAREFVEGERNRVFQRGGAYGKNIGTENDSKMSLLDVIKNKIIQAIEEKGRVKICVVHQDDRSGFH